MDRLAYEENAGPGTATNTAQNKTAMTQLDNHRSNTAWQPRLCQRRFDGSCSRFNYADLPPCTVSFCTQDAPQRRAPNNSPRASRRPLSMRAYVEGAPMTRVTGSRAPARWRRFPHNQGPDGYPAYISDARHLDTCPQPILGVAGNRTFPVVLYSTRPSGSSRMSAEAETTLQRLAE